MYSVLSHRDFPSSKMNATSPRQQAQCNQCQVSMVGTYKSTHKMAHGYRAALLKWVPHHIFGELGELCCILSGVVNEVLATEGTSTTASLKVDDYPIMGGFEVTF